MNLFSCILFEEEKEINFTTAISTVNKEQNEVYVGAKQLLQLLEDDKNIKPEILCQAKSLNQSLQNFIGAYEYKPPLIKSNPKVFKGFSADEFYDVTKDLAYIPTSQWTEEQILKTVERMREVNCFFMRGTEEARRAFSEFYKKWNDFVGSRPDIKELLDPVLVLFDIPWVTPPAWAASAIRANSNIGAPLAGVTVPVVPPGVPSGSPPPPAAGVSDIFWTTNGPDCLEFGGFMHGQHYGSLRGYWRIICNAPPVYF